MKNKKNKNFSLLWKSYKTGIRIACSNGKETGSESEHVGTKPFAYLWEQNKSPVGDTDRLNNILATIFTDILNAPTGSIEKNTDLRGLNIESILLTEAAERLNSKYGINVDPAKLYEFVTIEKMSEYIADTDKKTSYVPKRKTTESFQLSEDIAVTGISARFPQSEDINEFWKNIAEQKDLIQEIPKERWDWTKYYRDHGEDEDKTKIKWGGFIKDADKFDAGFFHISPREAELMDPQQRITIETVCKAIEDAGYSPSQLSGSKTGIFIGIWTSEYGDLLNKSGMPACPHSPTGTSFSILPNRISYLLDFHGPSEPVDTACSSSLVAVHRAVVAIKNKECDIALAGGVNLLFSPRWYIAFDKAGMLSPDGRCKTFNNSANGYVRGEGVGIVLLKPLSKAIADRDHIYGVIKSTGVNHGGYTNSLTAPNPDAQARLLTEVYEKAGIAPDTVSYIETHGTGTKLGDPIEINGIIKAFSELYRKNGKPLPDKKHCGLGAVKTAIGHLESAAGIAGLIKTLLAMKYKTMPGIVHFNELNPQIKLDNSPFYIADKTSEWEPLEDENGRLVRRAGISSFGFGGANAHVVIEGYEDRYRRSAANCQPPYIFVLSAKNEESLKEYAGKMAKFLFENLEPETGNFDISDVAYTLQTGREAMEQRLAFIANNKDELVLKLQDYCNGKQSENLYIGNVKRDRAKSEFLLEDKEGTAFLKIIIEEKELPKLIKLWVSGIETDWNLLYPEEKPRRISLPTYPFAKERYWIKTVESCRLPIASGQWSENRLHPLLHRNTSDFSEQRFSSTFTGSEFFLADHVVQGQKVLPGVAYLEMARAAIEQAAKVSGATGITLKNVVWARPIVVKDDPVDVHIGLFPEENGEIAYEIYTRSDSKSGKEDAEPQVHSQATALLNITDEIPALDIESLKAECRQKVLNADECYEAFAKAGLKYGAGHRGIEKIYVGEGKALAKLALPASVSDTADRFVLHPGLMDSALQASTGLTIASGKLEPALPSALKRLEIFGGCTSSMWAYVRYGKGSSADDNVKKLDIDLCDEQGSVCVRMKEINYSLSAAAPSHIVDKSGLDKPMFRLNTASRQILLYGDYSQKTELKESRQSAIINKTAQSKPAKISLKNSISLKKKDTDYSKKPITLISPELSALSDKDTSSLITAISINRYEQGVYRIKCCDKGHTPESVYRGIKKSLKIIEQDSEGYAVIIDGWGFDFLSLKSDSDIALKIFNALTECKLPVIAVINDGTDTAGMIAGLCSDIMILGRKGRYKYQAKDLKGILNKKQQIALISNRFGDDCAAKWVNSGLNCTGKELKVRGVTIQVAAESDISATLEAIINPLLQTELLALQLLKQHLGRNIKSVLNGDLTNSSLPDQKIDKQTDISQHSIIDLLAYKKLPLKDRSVKVCGTPTDVKIDSDVMTLKLYPHGILMVKMCDTESKNTFSKHFTEGIVKVFEHIESNDEYKVVVLTGYDSYFACGGTKEQLVDIYDGKSKFTDTKIYSLAMECRIPVISAMQGHGIGAGWSMGMFSDFIIFSEESIYVSNYMRYGFTPGAGATLIFPERFGEDLGREILFTANEYKGSDLYERNILYPVLAREKVLPYAMGIAEQLSEESREQLIMAKQLSVQKLRNQIKAVYEQELLMHEKTFVGNKRVLERIDQEFIQGMTAGAEPAESVFARSSTQSDDTKTAGVFSGDHLKNIREKLRSMLAEELYIQAENIDDDTEFIEMGLDSIIGVTWVRKITEEYGLSIPATKLYKYPNLCKLSEYVLNEGQRQGIFYEEDAKEKTPISSEVTIGSLSSLPTREIHSIRHLYRSTRNIGQVAAMPDIVESEKESPAIAIIGVSGRFPKSDNVAEFWDVIYNKVDCIDEVPEYRWDMAQYYDKDPQVPGKSYSKWMGAVEGADQFDPLFFQISPSEAELMEPQQRLFLEQAWSCLEDAGYSPEALSASRCGVFVGCLANDYLENNTDRKLTANAFIGGSPSILAARISYLLNLQGPCLAIDTACSSSLVAIAEACNSLMLGTSELAIAGGVCVIPGPSMHIMTSKAGMLSENGHCFTFDNRANGFVLGEGVGVVALKRLSDALKENDNICGIIRGWGINQDGRTNGITAPNQDSQIRLQKETYNKNGINPEDIQLIEAHGAATKLGDPIEIEALIESFRSYTDKKNYCALGSVKSNIGHSLAASGVAGVIKVLMALKHRQLPPTINFESLNEHIRLDDSPFYVNTDNKEWKAEAGKKRMAAVSSFGFSGTNAHIIIEEPPGQLEINNGKLKIDVPYIFVLSARNEDRLKDYALKMIQHLNYPSSTFGYPLFYTLQVGREAMEERLALIVNSFEDLKKKLESFIAGKDNIKEFYRGSMKRNKDMLAVFKADEDLQKATDAWIAKGKYSKLLGLWVNGLVFDWNRIYGENKPKRVSLPAYPFAKERYWIPKFSKQIDKETGAIHPLIDRLVPALPSKGLTFKKTFMHNDLIIKNYKADGLSVLADAAELEMAYAAIFQIEKERNFTLQQLSRLQPVSMQEGKKEINIVLKQIDEHLEFEIRSIVDDTPVIHSKGKCIYKSRFEKEVQRISVTEIKTRCSKTVYPEAFYKKIEKSGFTYGNYFKVIKECWSSKKEALCYFSLAQEFSDESESYTLHPALTNCAFDLAKYLNDDKCEKTTGLADIGRISVFYPLKSEGYVFVQAVDKNVFNIAISDETGIVRAKLYDVALDELTDPFQQFFYKPVWQTKPLEIVSEKQSKKRKTVLIIHPTGTNGLHEALADIHKKDDVTGIQIGNPGDRESLVPAKSKQIDIIYFLGGIQTEDINISDPDALVQSQESGVLSLFRLVKSLDSKNLITDSLKLKVITDNVYQVTPECRIKPSSASISGLLKSISREYLQLQISNIDIDLEETSRKKEMQGLVKSVLAEPGHKRGKEIAIRNGKRYVRTIMPLLLPRAKKTFFKSGGVYLLIGGAGRIGFVVSKYLAETFQANLILTGRSKISGDVKRKSEEIEAKGGKVLYIKADIAETESMKSAVRKAKAAFGQINGVVHMAMIHNMATVADMDEKTFQKSWLSKGKGIAVLFHILKNEPLDFMIFFSSVQSFLSDPQMSSYGIACNAKDALALYWSQKQNDYPVKTINWGFWKNSFTAPAQKKYDEKEASKTIISNPAYEFIKDNEAFINTIKKSGHKFIEDNEGMEAIMRISGYDDTNQVVAVKADNYLLESIKCEIGEKADKTKETASDENLQTRTICYVKSVFSKTLKMKEAKIENNVIFGNYGISSIMAKAVIAQFGKHFKKLPVTLLLEYKTINELSDYFMSAHREKLIEILRPEIGISDTEGLFADTISDNSDLKTPSHEIKGKLNRTQRQCFRNNKDFVCSLTDSEVSRLLSEFAVPDDNFGQPYIIENKPAAKSTVFMFPGLGDHYVNMGKGLYETEKIFRDQIDICCNIVKPLLNTDLKRVIYTEDQETNDKEEKKTELQKMLSKNKLSDNLLNQITFTHSAVFITEYALAKLWISRGIKPDAMIGLSLGEYAAACLAGVMSLEDTLHILVKRAQLIDKMPKGAMLATLLSEEEVLPLLGDDLNIGVVATPCSCMISGNTDAISALENKLAEQEKIYSRMQVTRAFHSKEMKPIGKEFSKFLKTVSFSAPQIPYISNITGTWITDHQATNSDYWFNHICKTVRFADGINQLLKNPNRIFLEAGPGSGLSSFLFQHPKAEHLSEESVFQSLRNENASEFIIENEKSIMNMLKR